MIPPTIENATHAGPMHDGRWALVMGYQALILKEGRPAAADGITARIATDLVKWEATEPHRRAKLLDLRAWLRGLKTPACERCDGGGSVTCSEDHEHECHRCKGTGEGFLTVDVAGAPMQRALLLGAIDRASDTEVSFAVCQDEQELRGHGRRRKPILVLRAEDWTLIQCSVIDSEKVAATFEGWL